jgi:predicted ATPase
MYFTAAQIAKSINRLADVHPFHGITFLACKEARLPIAKTIEFSLDANTDAFLKKHHRIDPQSEWFLQPFKSSDATKKWVRPDYSAKGLQTVNTQTFGPAFIHPRGTRTWGWEKKYVDVLVQRLPRKQKVPAFDLAVWLYRDRAWPKEARPADVVRQFANEFRLTDDEKDRVFDMAAPPLAGEMFQESPATWAELRKLLPPAPDSKPDEGGTLTFLQMRGLGPASTLTLEPATRLTLITGDNGLGKTFLLECAWWALTGVWAGRPAYPNPSSERKKVEITFAIEGEQSSGQKTTISFDSRRQSWPQPKKRPTIPGLIVYARVDGSFAVWDPARQTRVDVNAAQAQRESVFTSAEVWDGLPGRIEGLIRDWIRWQNSQTKSPFDTFTKVLKHLSPPDLGTLEPGAPVRIPDDPRDIPTIKHPFGTIPIVYTSAGVRRIITLAYLVVWAWSEHVVAAEHARTKPQRRMVVLVDEIEAHLHPRWQRSVLPALLSVGEMLSSDLQVQYLVATHSPLVMASSEPVFDTKTDALVHLDLKDNDVKLEEIDFVKFGDISAWLTSPVFELRHARSNEAEAAIEEAKALQLQRDPSAAAIRDVSSKLVRYLSSDDKFWPRWIYFAERFGVKL